MNKFIKTIKNIYVLIFINIIIFLIMFITILNKKAMPIITSYAESKAKRLGIEVLRNTGLEEVNKIIKEEELYSVIKNNNGEIESIDFDTSTINKTLLVIAKSVRKKLSDLESEENISMLSNSKKGMLYEVPIGVAFGNSFFSSFGPKVPVKIEYVGNVSLDVKSRVSEYGVNSALIEVYIFVQAVQKTILPFQSNEMLISSEIPIIMKVVKGSVPNLYNSKNTYALPIN